VRRDDIPTRCATNPDNRTRAVVTIEPDSDDLLSVVDEAERFGKTPPEASVASCLASYGNGGEDSGYVF
jgi:hypothetical protein